MPTGSVLLRPGVDVQMTFALNEAGISQSQAIRTKNGLTQTLGGWQQWGIATIPSTVNNLWAWQDVTRTDYLAVGARNNLVAMTTGTYQDITPLTRTSCLVPNVSISSANSIVTIVDPDAGLSVYDSVVFQTPISIGDIILQGAYPIYSVPSTGSFAILSSVQPSTTVAGGGILPQFTTVANSAFVGVYQPNHTAQAIIGEQQTYLVPTTVDGLTIQGAYSVSSVADSSSYTIGTPTQATGVATVTMNTGIARYLYYVVPGPPPSGAGYGGGGYGLGGYGVGIPGASEDTGTPITTDEYSLGNWGEILISNPKDGPLFMWSPSNGYRVAQLITQAPLTNGGFFISMPQMILVAWKSTQFTGTQDNLIVRWSDAQDFTNWDVNETTTAGSFHIPTGSVIRGGLQAPNYGVVWTDVDAWIMQYIGPNAIFNFTRAGSGCGLIAEHAAGVLAGNVYWCGESSFFVLSGAGVEVLPCTVWDYIFQNINEDAKSRIHCAPNSAFHEISWFFPSGTNTENDSYVKYNLVDKTWDYGVLPRTAWIDVSVLGNPIAADPQGVIWGHEEGNSIVGTASSYFKTGWWAINDGEDLAFVDFIMPDFIWGTYPDRNPGGSVDLTFFSCDYPGDAPRTYGPYTVTQANQYITPRIRGRLLAMEAKSNSGDMFWRIGRIRYRWAPAGRR